MIKGLVEVFYANKNLNVYYKAKYINPIPVSLILNHILGGGDAQWPPSLIELECFKDGFGCSQKIMRGILDTQNAIFLPVNAAPSKIKLFFL